MKASRSDSEAHSIPPPRRARRWLRRLLVALIALAVLIPLAWQALTSSWFLAPRVESALSALVGGKVTVGSADLNLDGRLRLTDVRLLVPGVRGAAGELLHIPDLEINLDRDELMAGRISVQRLTIDDALLRFSEDLDSGRFNIGGLALRPSSASTPPAQWPRVELRSGVVQIGEHRGATFNASGEIRVGGSLRPEARQGGSKVDDWYAFDLKEIVAAPSGEAAPGMRMTGRFDLRTGEGSSIISGVSFAPRQADLLPRVARQWWKSIEPSGSLQPIVVQISPGGRYEIEIAMDGIDWSLPVPSFDPRRDTQPPRMTNVRGSVVIHDGVVDLIGLSGEIDGVRYRLTGSFASVDQSPGFDLTFDVERFDLSSNMNMLTALPVKVRELVDNQLVQLGGPTGLLDAHVTLHRDPIASEATAEGAAPPPRPVRASGRVELVNAEGTYREFPYPLSGLRGAIEFDDQEIRIVALAGRGPSGGQIFVSGRISPMDADPQVEVEMYANHIPIDEHLLAALGPSRRSAITEFFNTEAMDRLQDAGLLLAEGDVEQLSEEVRALLREHRDLTESPARDERSAARLDAILARVEEIERSLARVFHLGGRINIRSTIRRERGPSQPTKVSNLVTLADRSRPLGAMYEEFPYPARLIAGEILIEYDRVAIVKDLVLEGVNGGRATIRGEVRRVREPVRRQEPNLTISVESIPVNEFLLRAIPGGRNGHGEDEDSGQSALSRAARVVAGLRLVGTLSADGRIYADDRGKADFDINVHLTEGSSRGADDIPSWEKGLDWRWPGSLPLSAVEAEVTVHRRSLDIHRFSGHNGEQFLDASGRIGWADGRIDINLDAGGRDLDLQPHLIDLASPLGSDEGVEEMRRFWSRVEPRGRADADVIYTKIGDETPTFDLILTPQRGSILVEGHRIEASNILGEVRISDGIVQFADVHADASSEGVSIGGITLDGALAYRPECESNLHGKVEGGRFEAPAFGAFAAGLSGLLARSPDDSVAPHGLFDATFHLTRPPNVDRPSYLINIQPGELDFTLGGERFEVRRLQGAALITPTTFELGDLSGAYQDGLIRLSGNVDRTRGINADLHLSVSADRLTGRVRALLPQAVNQLIDAIDLEVGQSVELVDARIQYAREPQEDPTVSPVASINFAGALNVRDASMNLSIPITELDGSLQLAAQRRSDEPWLHGQVEMNVSRMLVLGRLVTDMKASLVSGDEPGQVEVSRLVGECYGGRLSAEGSVRVPWMNEPGRYDLRLSLAQVAVDPILRRVAPRRPPGAEEAETAAESSTEPITAPPRPRPGRLDAGLAVAGAFGRPESRIGRGEIRVREAELYEVPLAMWALQLSALTLPVSTSFREADVDYYIDGNEVVFERLSLDSPSMSLNGRGALNYASQALDMEFNTASKLRAPFLTPIWESLRDLFMTIRVTGTLERPVANLQRRSGSMAQRRRPVRGDAEPSDLVIAPITSD